MLRKLKVLGAFAACALGLAATPAVAEQYRLGLITPPPHQWTVFATQAAAEIKEATAGRVDILIFPSGQLGSEAQMLQQLQTGALDFAFLTVGELSNRDPNYGVFLAPYLVSDIHGAKKLLTGPAAGKLLEGVSKFGLKGLGWSSAGMRTIVMRGPVESVADLAGKKVRTVPNAVELDFWTTLGAAPTPMPLPALYDAFANGQVDGMQVDHEGTWNTKYFDHAGTILDSRHAMFPMIAVASGRKWQGISPEDQAAIQKVVDEKTSAIIDAYAQLDDKYMKDLQGTKVPVKTVDRAWFGPALDKFYDNWRQKAPALAEFEAEAKSN